MFLGEYFTRFSGQGRIILPKKLRQEIDGDRIVLSKGFELCVWGFSLADWQKEAEKQLQIPITEEKGRILRRYLFSTSEMGELDKQGRFIIPTALIAYANLQNEVFIIGAGDHFEIWNEDNWLRYREMLEKEYKG